jgi:hypothetical protein
MGCAGGVRPSVSESPASSEKMLPPSADVSEGATKTQGVGSGRRRF